MSDAQLRELLERYGISAGTLAALIGAREYTIAAYLKGMPIPSRREALIKKAIGDARHVVIR